MYKHFRTKLSVLGGVIILDNMQRYLSILHFLKSNNNDKETIFISVQGPLLKLFSVCY